MAARRVKGSNFRLDRRALFSFEELTKRDTLRTLHLSGCVLGPSGAQSIAKGVRTQGSGLKVLKLDDCRLRADGALSILSMLAVSSVGLVELSIAGNGIGDDGTLAAAQALRKNRKLTHLCLARNRITDGRIAEFACSIEAHESLSIVDLGDNSLSFKGAQCFAAALLGASALVQLRLPRNEFTIDALW